MSMRGNRSRVNHERWLVSYADFITLLFAFFVVLYAFAKAGERKQQMVSEAITDAFRSLGAFPSGEAAERGVGLMHSVVETGAHADITSAIHARDDLESLRTRLEKVLAPQLEKRTVSLHMGHDGLVVSLREAGFFPSGSATPLPGAESTLREVARSLQETPFEVRVEGHTDNVPIHTGAFDSNWELSSARATSIARLFLSMHAVPGAKISAAGYAEYHPIATNATEAGRAQNRRVDLVIMPESRVNFAAIHPTDTRGSWHRVDDP